MRPSITWNSASTPQRRSIFSELASDAEVMTALGLAGQDRARAFTWRDAAEKTWQLRADL